MKNKIVFILIIAFLLFVFTPTTVAWLVLTRTVDISTTAGSIITNYFHCGTGSEDDPFVITRPVHLWNLTMLYQLLEDFDTSNYYFQIGYDLDNSGNLSVYEYNDQGKATGNLCTNLNMMYYTDFVPIGTINFPFNGTFTGNNITVSNLTVHGEDEGDIGFFGYTGKDATISNLYIEHLTIIADNSDIAFITNDTNHTAHTESVCYVGYLVGHADTFENIHDVYFNDVTISGTASTVLKNELGYFGHCEDAPTLEQLLQAARGDQNGFGGSVDMRALYDRLYAIEGLATQNRNYIYDTDYITDQNGNTFYNTTLTGTAYTYSSKYIGNFVFSQARGQYLYLHGGTTVTPEIRTIDSEFSGVKIYSGNNYLSTDGTSIMNSSEQAATVWIVSGNNIYTTVNGVRYYLGCTGSTWTGYSLTVSRTASTWTFGTNTIYYRANGNRSYYIRYNNGWTLSTTTSNVYRKDATGYNIVTTRGQSYVDYSGNNNTYFPLIAESNYTVSRRNTGYVISGSNDRTTSGTYPAKSGDIRVSQYTTSDISNSYRNGQLTTVYTINQLGRQETVNANNYVRYNTVAPELLDMISGGNVYGLHFMSGLIDKSNLVTADYVCVNDNDYENYQLPANSIDFTLVEKGYITFMAGTYFTGNNSFFSLHHIIRDQSDNISEIKEISEIFSDGNKKHPYIYRYADGTFSGTLTSEYTSVFSTTQIKKQSTLTSKAIYYFEIPVNEGEYALGSVEGGTGAYLIYLDIGTNGGTESAADLGNIEYRSSPDTIDYSILIISYTQSQNTTLSTNVTFADNVYTVTCSGSGKIYITLLSNDYTVKYKNNEITVIGTYEFEIS